MTKLATLRSQLDSLRRRRTAIRLGGAFSILAVVILLTLTAAFIVDVALELDKLQRFVSLSLVIGISYWAFKHFTLPSLGQHEDEIDVALEVEQRHKIDSDLVSALQFESPAANQWGSTQLETAVIDYVADFSPGLNIFEGISHESIKKQMTTLFVISFVLLFGIMIFPGYFAAFANRFFLGSVHYPTDTVIEKIIVNDQQAFPAANEDLQCAYAKPVKFTVHCSGVLPPSGHATLTSKRSGVTTEIDLKRINPEGESAIYVGQHPRLIDTVDYRLDLGDAWTDPQEISVIPLPIVTTDLLPTPPSYASHTQDEEHKQEGSRQIAVIEGSKVDVRVECKNKDLVKAVIKIGEQSFPLSPMKDNARIWSLGSAKTPLTSVTETIRYEIEVEDVDGLGLERPIQGFIGLRTDRLPRVAVAMISKRVIPTAKPTIVFGATDDYGLSHLKVLMEVIRQDGQIEEATQEITVVPAKNQPKTVLRGEYGLDLSHLKLVKGDEVKLKLQAADYRGRLQPKVNESEPLILQVTDRNGILAGLMEIDEKSARHLDAIIKRELGIGERQ